MARKTSGKEKKKKQGSVTGKKVNSTHTRQYKNARMDNIKGWVEKGLPYLMLTVISLLLFIGPFERGLFFPRELLIAKVVIFGLLIVWGWFRLFKKDGRLLDSPLDICLIVLLLAYFISFFFAVHKRDALEELLKVASYLVVYLVALDISRYWWFPAHKLNLNQEGNADQEDQESSSYLPPGVNLVLHVALLAAFVVTVASLGVPAGHWEFAGAYASNRIASPMGYANTAAAYLMAAYLLALGLAPLAKKWFKVLYLAPAALMLITVVLTFSRGAWILLPPLSMLLVLVAAPGERLRSFLYLLVTGLTAVPAALMVDPVFRSDTPAQAWVLIIGAVAAAVFLGLLVELYLSQSRKLRIALAGGGSALVLAALFVVSILPALGPIQLERTADESAESQSVEQVISNAIPEEVYQLAMEINAKAEPVVDEEEPAYAWRVRVLGLLPGYRDVEVLDERGGATDGWEKKEFTFETEEDMERLDVRIYNRYPGTSVNAREVTLRSEETEHNLRFALNRMLPDRFYDRIFSYSLDRNLRARVDFMEDAVEVIGDYTMTGAGGGGWNALYRAYQDRPYNTTEVHNHFLQVWIEAGLFGFLAFVGIWVSFAVAFIRNCLKNRVSLRVWQLWAASFLPVAALGAHSVIDWSFSMGAVGIFLFVLLGAGRSLDNNTWFPWSRIEQQQPGRRGMLIGISGAAIGLFMFIYTLILLSGINTTWRSQELMEMNNIKGAKAEMRKAIELDPFRTDNYHNLGVLIEDRANRTGEQADMEEIISLARKAYELEPYNPRYVSRYGDLLFRYVDLEEGLEYIDRLIYLRPFSESGYMQAASSRLQLANFYLEEGNRSEAERHLYDIIELGPIMKENYGDIKPLAFILGRASYLLGDYSSAISYFEKVEEGDNYYEEAQSHLEGLKDE